MVHRLRLYPFPTLVITALERFVTVLRKQYLNGFLKVKRGRFKLLLETVESGLLYEMFPISQHIQKSSSSLSFLKVVKHSSFKLLAVYLLVISHDLFILRVENSLEMCETRLLVNAYLSRRNLTGR